MRIGQEVWKGKNTSPHRPMQSRSARHPPAPATTPLPCATRPRQRATPPHPPPAPRPMPPKPPRAQSTRARREASRRRSATHGAPATRVNPTATTVGNPGALKADQAQRRRVRPRRKGASHRVGADMRLMTRLHTEHCRAIRREKTPLCTHSGETPRTSSTSPEGSARRSHLRRAACSVRAMRVPRRGWQTSRGRRPREPHSLRRPARSHRRGDEQSRRGDRPSRRRACPGTCQSTG